MEDFCQYINFIHISFKADYDDDDDDDDNDDDDETILKYIPEFVSSINVIEYVCHLIVITVRKLVPTC